MISLLQVDFLLELEALGDELAADADTSYLDAEIAAPTAPSKEPGAESVAAVSFSVIKFIARQYNYTFYISNYFQDGQVDEFGLPKIPAS